MVVEPQDWIGITLRNARQERAKQDPRGYSLRAVAGRLGVSATYLSLVERGVERPTEAFLRRLAGGAAPDPGEVWFADVRIQLARFRLWKGREEHLLSHTEAGLLRLFLAHPDTPLPRARILSEVWGEDVYPTERTVDNFILKLRRKIEDDPTAPRFLRTVHGVGYCFSAGEGE